MVTQQLREKHRVSLIARKTRVGRETSDLESFEDALLLDHASWVGARVADDRHVHSDARLLSEFTEGLQRDRNPLFLPEGRRDQHAQGFSRSPGSRPARNLVDKYAEMDHANALVVASELRDASRHVRSLADDSVDVTEELTVSTTPPSVCHGKVVDVLAIERADVTDAEFARSAAVLPRDVAPVRVQNVDTGTASGLDFRASACWSCC